MLGLAVTDYLYPRFEAERFGAGRLTKLRAQTVSGRSCKAVAERLGLPERLLAAAPERTSPTARALISTERVLASVMEAVIRYLLRSLKPFGREVVSLAAVASTSIVARPRSNRK